MIGLPLCLIHLSVALAPIPEVGFVLQVAGAFGAAGGLLALRARRRWPESDASRIAQAWTALGLVAGVLTALVVALVELAR